MAHVVGVPKRDFCQKCELPVFLAERMVIGKKIFHRTCLKCARCRSQLTPGSFYETEVDDEYCCETCPDEEDSNDELLKRHDFSNGNERSSVRNSIAERLAFFEKSDETHGVESKNISDEEKSKSLKHLAEYATVSQSSFKMSNAFNDFLKSDDNKSDKMEVIEIDEDEDEDEDSEHASEVLHSDVSLTDSPKIPMSLPPLQPRFTTTAQLNLKKDQEEHNLELDDEKPIPKSRLINISFSLSDEDNNEYSSTIATKSYENDKINNNGLAKEHQNIENVSEAEHKLDLVENNKTKDDTDNQNLAQISMANTASAETELQKELKNLQTESCTDEVQQDDIEIRQISQEDVATTARLSVVSARLQEFEVNNNSSDEKENEIDIDNHSEKTLISPSTTTLTNVALETEKTEAVEVEVEVSSHAEAASEMEIDETTIPTDLAPEQQSAQPESMQENVRKTVEKSSTEEYPEDLNPFKSDDDDEEENKENQVKQKKDDLNPFDSSDDEIELEKIHKGSRPVSIGKVPPPRPPPPRISRNPFGADEDFSRHSSLTSSMNKEIPVPTPRSTM